MYFYKAFDLTIESEISIPQFIPTENRLPEVRIKRGDVKKLLPPNFETDRVLKKNDSEIFFYWEQVGWFTIRDGNEIIFEAYPSADESMVRLPLIGIVFAALLHQRGMMVLHASAVAIKNNAVAFIGWKGAGKSTTAMILYKRGHTMISDDIVAVKISDHDSNLTVVPSFPNFKLMPEAASAVLGDDPNSLSPIYQGIDKRFRSVFDNFSSQNLPLKAIFMLEQDDNLDIQALSPQAALPALIANTYLARYGKELLQNNQAKNNLRQCSAIINSIPIYRLKRPKSFEVTNELALLIEELAA